MSLVLCVLLNYKKWSICSKSVAKTSLHIYTRSRVTLQVMEHVCVGEHSKFR